MTSFNDYVYHKFHSFDCVKTYLETIKFFEIHNNFQSQTSTWHNSQTIPTLYDFFHASMSFLFIKSQLTQILQFSTAKPAINHHLFSSLGFPCLKNTKKILVFSRGKSTKRKTFFSSSRRQSKSTKAWRKMNKKLWKNDFLILSKNSKMNAKSWRALTRFCQRKRRRSRQTIKMHPHRNSVPSTTGIPT